MSEVSISEAVGMAFKAIGKNEASIHELAEHIKTIADYRERGIETITSRVSAYLSNAVKPKSRTTAYANAINPKTKQKRKGVYRLVVAKAPIPPIPHDQSKKMQKPPSDKQGTLFAQPKGKPSPIPVDETSDPIRTSYIGKCGEYAVASELLFRDYNVGIMSVDEGIDIMASKNDKFFFIQVKTTSLKDGRLSVPIEPNRFVMGTNASVHYVIVVRNTRDGVYTNRYIIIPESALEKLKWEGVVGVTQSGGCRIKIKQEGGLILFYDRDKESNATYHLDNFDLIK